MKSRFRKRRNSSPATGVLIPTTSPKSFKKQSVAYPKRGWDIEPAKWESQVLCGHEDGISTLSQMDNGDLLSGSNDGIIMRWPLVNSSARQIKPIKIFKDHSTINAITVLTESLIAIASDHGVIQIYDMNADVILNNIRVGRAKALTILKLEEAFGLGNLAVGLDNGVIKVFERRSKTCVQTFNGHTAAITALIILDQSLVASSSADNTIRVWDRDDGSCLKVLQLSELNIEENAITSMIKLKNGNLLCGYANGVIRAWDWEQGECVVETPSGLNHRSDISCLFERMDGVIASGSTDGTIKIWKLIARGPICFQTIEHGTAVTDIAENQSGDIIVGSQSNDIVIWNPPLKRISNSQKNAEQKASDILSDPALLQQLAGPALSGGENRHRKRGRSFSVTRSTMSSESIAEESASKPEEENGAILLPKLSEHEEQENTEVLKQEITAYKQELASKDDALCNLENENNQLRDQVRIGQEESVQQSEVLKQLHQNTLKQQELAHQAALRQLEQKYLQQLNMQQEAMLSLKDENSKLQQQIEQVQEQAIKSEQDIKHQYRTALREKDYKHQDSLAQQKHAYIKELSNANDALKESEAKNTKLKQRLEKTQLEATSSKQSLIKQYESSLNEKELIRKKIITELKQSHQQEISKQKDASKDLEATFKQARELLLSERKENQRNKQSIILKHKQVLRTKTLAYEKETKNLQDALHKLEEEFDQLKQSYAETKSKLTRKYKQRKVKLHQANKELEEMALLHDQDMADLDSEYQNAFQAQQNVIIDLQNKISQLQKEHCAKENDGELINELNKLDLIYAMIHSKTNQTPYIQMLTELVSEYKSNDNSSGYGKYFALTHLSLLIYKFKQDETYLQQAQAYMKNLQSYSGSSSPTTFFLSAQLSEKGNGTVSSSSHSQYRTS